MKIIFYLTIVTLLLTANTFAQYIDSIKNYPGIPIITYRGCVIRNASGGPYLTPDDFKFADSSGIYAMEINDVNENDFTYYIAPTKLKVMPSEISKNLTDFILTYTEARYTEFEAEGTPWENGVTLYSDSLDLDKYGGYVSTKPSTSHGTMIYGPMYRQCRNYVAIESRTPVPYRASYIIKIDNTDSSLHSLPTDTVCILQVTSTKTWDLCKWIVGADTFSTQYYSRLNDTLIHAQKVITYGQLHPSRGDTVNLDYKFTTDVPWFGTDRNNYPVAYKNTLNIENDLQEKISQNCVEFKVIWKGKADRVKLSVDKIIVSDLRGRELKNPDFYQTIKSNIETQIDLLQAFTNNKSVGFIGIDEPWSVDMWEPIRIVNDIVSSYTPQNGGHYELYYQFNAQAYGRFQWSEDPGRGSRVEMIDEFMRRVGKANVWVTGWLYDIESVK